MERLIIEQLINNTEYFQSCYPYIKKEYFKENTPERILFENLKFYSDKYNKVPTCKELTIITRSRKNLTEELYRETNDLIGDILNSTETPDKKWLVDNTEEFCKKTEFYNCILDVIECLDNGNAWQNVDLEKFQDALGISFEPQIGHKYFAEAALRWDDLHSPKNYFTTGIKALDKALDGGFIPKTLNIFMALAGVGKTMIMVNGAVANMFAGKKVLYLTAEVSEFRIGDRIDANILDMKMQDVKKLTRDRYLTLLEKKNPSAAGEIIIKEYPTSSATVLHIRNLINELKLKEGFEPDIVYVDYLNIFASYKYQNSKNVNSYTSVKSVAEEFRALGQELNVPIVSATQTNRSGVEKSSNVDVDSISESFGVLATVDFLGAAIRTDELDESNQILLKLLKSRYSDISLFKHVFVNVDREKQKCYDIDQPIDVIKTMPETAAIMSEIEKEFEEAKKKDDSNRSISFDDVDD